MLRQKSNDRSTFVALRATREDACEYDRIVFRVQQILQRWSLSFRQGLLDLSRVAAQTDVPCDVFVSRLMVQFKFLLL